jgi:prepilin-type N-terminal cleavage/methylation domain-containing protein/prepilin-type processing-associated H-X9-DG protein
LGQPSRTVGRRQSGFTLVELLIVIAIIAILAAVLLAVFPQGLEMARRASCVSGVKQITAAASMYAHDHDRRFIPAITRGAPGDDRGYTWCTIIQPYLDSEQILICPNDSDPRATEDFVCLPHSYGLNYRHTFNTAFGWNPGSLTAKLTNVDQHSKRILVFELDSEARDPGMSYRRHRLSRVDPRHGDRAVFGFIDGHAEALRPNETVDPLNMWE